MSEEVLFDGDEQPHLLLVDDDETFTRIMARVMTRKGLRAVSYTHLRAHET